jgi:hypothetical protein
LLSLWLFFGSLAFAEELNVIVETSSQDEAALMQLVHTLKPDVPTFEGRMISTVTATLTALTSPLPILPASLSLSDWIPAPNHSALRLHQHLSVYRI